MSCHFLQLGNFPSQGSNLVSCVFCIGRQILYDCATWETQQPSYYLPCSNLFHIFNFDIIYSHYLTYCFSYLCQKSCYFLFFHLLFFNPPNKKSSGGTESMQPLPEAERLLIWYLFLDQWEAGTSEDFLQPTHLGSLGQVNSHASKRDVLGEINHLKWHKSRRTLLHFLVRNCVDFLSPKMYSILEPHVREDL